MMVILSNEVFGKIRARNLTVNALAKRIGVKPQTLSKKIKGASRIYHDEIVKISEELDLTDEEVLHFFYHKVS